MESAPENSPISHVVEKKSELDANDYSRFDNIEDSDDETGGATSSATSSSAPALTYTEAVNLANIMKDVGNTSFKASSTTEALKSYEEAVSALQKLSKEDQKKEEASNLLVNLYGNISMCHFKCNDWKKTVASASLVLETDAGNIKALYRRGCSHHKMQAFEDAKKDLTRCISLDNSNLAAKKELVEVEKSFKEYTAKQRAAFGGMFGGNSSMYEDKEKQRLAKLRQEEEKEAKLKDDWTKDKISRRNKGEAELTYEEWKTAKEKEEKEKKDAEKKASAKTSASSPRPTSSKKPKVIDSDDESDEETKKLIKGYKKTSDGRKTSYFNNELDDQTKKLIGDIAPKTLVVSESIKNSSIASAPLTAPSVWNQAGTFEEKDMTAWAKERLTALFKDCKLGIEATGAGDSVLTGAIHVAVTNVKSVEGEAEIIISRGKTRYLYDFEVKLEWEAVLTAFPLADGTDDSKDKKFKGQLQLNCSPDNEVESSITHKKQVPPEHRDRVEGAMKSFVLTVKEKINQFSADYQQSAGAH